MFQTDGPATAKLSELLPATIPWRDVTDVAKTVKKNKNVQPECVDWFITIIIIYAVTKVTLSRNAVQTAMSSVCTVQSQQQLQLEQSCSVIVERCLEKLRF